MLNILKQELIKAMKEKNIPVKEVLTVLISNINNKVIEVKHELSEFEIISLVKKEIKQCKETMSFASGRNEIENSCMSKINFLKQYIPQEVNADVVYGMIEEIIRKQNVCLENIKKGDVMKIIMPKLKGIADGQLISSMVDKFLLVLFDKV